MGATAQRSVIRIAKHTAEGQLAWERIHNELWSDRDRAWDVSVDPEGNVLVAANLHGVEQDQYNIWLANFDGKGEKIWSRAYRRPGQEGIMGRSLAIDNGGNIFAVGVFAHSELWIANFASTGEQRWSTNQFKSLKQSLSDGTSMKAICGFPDKVVVDEERNLYVLGRCGGYRPHQMGLNYPLLFKLVRTESVDSKGTRP